MTESRYLRWRNEENQELCYSSAMENLIDGEMTVKQVLETHPQTIPVFIEMKTLCVGCPLEQFCTLEEVAMAYKIPSDLLLDKLCASISIRSRRNA